MSNPLSSIISAITTGNSEVQQVTGVKGATPQSGAAAVASAAGSVPAAFSSVESGISAFYAIVTNYKMWRSLGWLLLGILVIFLGLWLWFGKIPPAVPL